MLLLLRKIRHKLMNENKLRSYLLYAIGEIFLVVIGILIAVSLNNWNEHRKTKLKSIGYLQRLNEDIELIHGDMESSTSHLERNFKNSLIVLNALETRELLPSQKMDFEEYLKRFYQYQLTVQDANTFNEMLSAGELNLIENPWIRTAFSNLSDNREFIIEVNRANHNACLQNAEIFERHIRFHFEKPSTDSTNSVPHYNFDSMADDTLFVNKISRQARAWRDISKMFKAHKQNVVMIRDSIQLELNKYDY